MLTKITIQLLVLLPLLLISCIQEHGEADTSRKDTEAFSVAEAHRFFENHTEHYFTRSGIPQQNFKRLNPGDFMPNWDKAKISQLHDLASVDVPIAASYRFRAIGCTFSNGRSEVRSVDVTQKLVVVKNLTTDSLGSYILTLIPNPAYATRHKGLNLCATFLNTGDKGKFSGIAIYTESVSGMLIRINQYRNGQKVRGVFIPGPPSEQKEKIRRAKLLVGKIRLGRIASVSTRSWGEDTWDWDGSYDNDNWNYDNEYTDIGGGWFEDQNGNLFYDTNGDGQPDSMGIESVEITPDPDPDPDPEDDPWFDDNGDDDWWNDDWWGDDWWGDDSWGDGEESSSNGDDEVWGGSGNDDSDVNSLGNPSNNVGDQSPKLPEGKEAEAVIQNLLYGLQRNSVAAKLLEKVSLKNISFREPKKADQGGGYNPNTGAIYLCIIDADFHMKPILLEELMHRYQYSQNDIHGQYKGNLEIEAKLLVWDYLRAEKYSPNDIKINFGRPWGIFGIFAENPCEETWNDAIKAIIQMGYSAEKSPTSSYKEFKTDNYKNVKEK